MRADPEARFSAVARHLLSMEAMTTSAPDASAARAAGAVIVVGGAEASWGAELEAFLAHHGYRSARVPELAMAPFLLLSRGVTALILEARRLGASDLAALARVRRLAPEVSIIAVASESAPAELKRAFEQGATTFVSWPAPDWVLLAALEG
jgi:DNA-binding response OmpR family regulator